MVVDDLLARSAALRTLSQDTHVIRAPFSVYPFDHAEGRLRWLRGRAPRGLIRLDGVRAPFPAVILASESAERGFQLVRTTLNEDGSECFTSMIVGSSGDFLDVDVTVSTRTAEGGLVAIEGFAPAWAWLAHRLPGAEWVRTWQSEAERTMPCPSRETVNALYARYLGARAALLAAVNGRLPRPDYFVSPATLTDEELTKRLAELAGASVHQFLTLACAFSLMSCRNVVLQSHTPSLALQKARVRRGQLPLVSWSEILVRPFGPKGNRQSGLSSGELQAVHWQRGHVKHYSGDSPLFGVPGNSGAYWFNAHLRGKDTSRRVNATYKLALPARPDVVSA